MDEVEIKLELERRRLAALKRAECLRRSRPVRAAFLALYFDTPDGDLARHHMALRLRREGTAWKQALKTAGSSAGGLHARDEWEFDADGPVLDLARFRDTALAELPHADRLHERLIEVFRVDVRRTRWNVGRGARRVEVVLDDGEVRAATGRAPILEVEIESKGEDAGAVFGIASRLIEAVPMRPSPTSKAARGGRLLRGEPPQPVRATREALDPSWSPAQSARRTVAAALRQLQANEDGVLDTDDPEFVHQLRIALRRLRSALRAHDRALEPGFAAPLGPELRWITQVAGAARDMDVLADTTLPAMAREGAPLERAERFGRVVERRRAAARCALREALRSRRYAMLVLSLARWLHAAHAHAPREHVGLRKFAAKAIRRRRRKVLAAGRHVERLDAAGRHRLRIETKKLRYAVEGFASLWPAGGVDEFLEVVSTLQDDLGRGNDMAIGARLLESLGAPEELAAFARGWLAAESHASIAPLAKHLEALRDAPRFWKGRAGKR